MNLYTFSAHFPAVTDNSTKLAEKFASPASTLTNITNISLSSLFGGNFASDIFSVLQGRAVPLWALGTDTELPLKASGDKGTWCPTVSAAHNQFTFKQSVGRKTLQANWNNFVRSTGRRVPVWAIAASQTPAPLTPGASPAQRTGDPGHALASTDLHLTGPQKFSGNPGVVQAHSCTSALRTSPVDQVFFQLTSKHSLTAMEQIHITSPYYHGNQKSAASTVK